jgi:hypothetical protein
MPLYIHDHHGHRPSDDEGSRAQSDEDSAGEVSPVQSPTNTHRIGLLRRHRSNMLSSSDLTARLVASKMDEHTPLLPSSGKRMSRVRIATGTTTPKPRLSRHHSATSECLSLCSASGFWLLLLASLLRSGHGFR